MQEISQHPQGTFSWIDVATTDLDSAKSFYGKIFGWANEDISFEGDVVYTIFQLHGKPVAGCGILPQDMQDQGIPPYWSSYIAVDDVDAIAAKAGELGATVVVQPMDIMDNRGRMSIIMDPTGAHIGFWQARAHIGTHYKNIPGTLVMSELSTRDTEKAGQFYRDLIGWTPKTAEVQNIRAPEMIKHTSFLHNDQMIASMLPIGKDWGDDVPPHWLPYIQVEDCERTVALVKKIGGSTMFDPVEVPDMGKFSLIRDPQGAMFNIAHFYG